MLRQFLDKPFGVGTGLNIHMLRPKRVLYALTVLARDPRYFINRTNVISYQIIHPSDPWLTRDAIRFIKAYLTKNMRVLEYGSGRSTAWLSERVKTLVSVEDDELWYRRVQHKLPANVDYRLVPKSMGSQYYASQCEDFPDSYFDLILIDGSARDACITRSRRKVKPNGVVVIDNADAGYDVSPLNGFKLITTDNGVWRTDIYINVHPRA